MRVFIQIYLLILSTVLSGCSSESRREWITSSVSTVTESCDGGKREVKVQFVHYLVTTRNGQQYREVEKRTIPLTECK